MRVKGTANIIILRRFAAENTPIYGDKNREL